MQSTYTIKDLEQLSGIKAHTLRIWESRYNLISPQRTDTNIRYYLDMDLKKVLNVAVLVNAGMRISKVARLSEREMNTMVLDLSRYTGNKESQINGLKTAMLEFNQELFERILNQSIAQVGTDETFRTIVAQFIGHIGVLWQTNTIGIAHEHFASNLIRQKLFAAIDQLPPVKEEGKKRFVLYLPSEELHELGILYTNYLLRKDGHEVIYLGQAVPAEYLLDVHNQRPVDAILSIFTTKPNVENLEEYFQRLHKVVGPDVAGYFTGYQIASSQLKEVPGGYTLFPDLPSLCKHLLSA